MKKLSALFLATLLVLSLSACGKTGNEPQQGQSADIPDAVTLLTTVWNSYGAEEKFAAGGGDAENMVMDAPGAFALTDGEAVDAMLGLPQSALSMVDDAASVMHMMNANNFTCGAYRVAEGASAQELASALQENIKNRQWLCGFPEELVIYTVDNYVVCLFGVCDITDVFQSKLTAAYTGAVLYCEESLV